MSVTRRILRRSRSGRARLAGPCTR
jgi:hypothetical protein